MRSLSKILILLGNLIIDNRGNTKDNSTGDEVSVEHNTPKKELVKINDDPTKGQDL